MNPSDRMKELIKTLNEASRAYYQLGSEIMPNERYDALYDELCALEKETGVVMSGSPTVSVGYEVLSSLPKERHQTPALSLDKTKEVSVLQEFLGNQTGILSWKLDGLTIVLTYEEGKLLKAVTRGNGEVGEVVTGNAKVFQNLPLEIPYKGHLVLRGEALISYPDFEKVNETIEEETKYKNPRNLCAGSVRQLDPKITKSRYVNLVAFALIDADSVDFKNSMNGQLDFLDAQGFETVPRVAVTAETLPEAVKKYAADIADFKYPSDGLVLVMDDIAYGKSLGRTAKFPRNAIAFKWRDEMAETTLREIEWNASRTGLINPIAVFDSVELEGTTVSRASVHNVSIVRELQLGIGDTITVYKANMIIPQISENKTKSGEMEIPAACPACGGPTHIENDNGVETLHCGNPECPAKKIQSFSQFVSRNAFNVDGLSEMTLEKWVDRGFVKTFADLFRINRYKNEIISMEGFGEKSYDNLLKAIEKARNVKLSAFLFSLGIPGVGVATGKLLSKAFGGSFENVANATFDELKSIDQVGEVLGTDIYNFFRTEKNMEMIDDLLPEISFTEEEKSEESPITGKSFVITGDVHRFKNRDELKSFIEGKGGSIRSSVTKKTDYLINNDTLSNSTKNKTAKELQIPILSEEDFLKLLED